jgi:hypothetical protein
MAVAPKCECNHAKSSHDAQGCKCYFAGRNSSPCPCLEYRPRARGVALPANLLPLTDTLAEREAQEDRYSRWNRRPSPRDTQLDHEANPEYEVHLGQIGSDGTRRVSIWLRGERWTGDLYRST